MYLADKYRSPFLIIATLPVTIAVYLTLSRIILSLSSPFLRLEYKLLQWLTRTFSLDEHQLTTLFELKRVSKTIQHLFLQQIQKSYFHQIARAPNSELKRKLNRTLNQIEIVQCLSKLYSYPFRIYLEITRNCNLRCRMCRQSDYKLPQPEISPEVLDKVKSIIPYCEFIALFGYGESLTAPHFFDYLTQLPFDASQIIELTTNGTLLTPEISEKIVESPITALRISLDAANEDTFEFCRGIRFWHKIIEQIHIFNQLKQSKKRETPILRLEFTAMRKNIEELPDFVYLAKQVHANQVDVGFLHVYSEDMREQTLFFYQDLANQKFIEAQKVANELHIQLNLPPLFNLNSQQHGRKSCIEPWIFAFINADGTIAPCATNLSIVGDLKDSDFLAIWNSQGYQMFRQMVNSNDISYRCRYCYDYRYKDNQDVNHHIFLLEPFLTKMMDTINTSGRNRMQFPADAIRID